MRHAISLMNRATILTLLIFIMKSDSDAQPVPWPHLDNTMHYYDAVAVPAGITWSDAGNAADSVGGYLVTLTSPEENDFVSSLIDSIIYWYVRPGDILAGPWTGGIQPPGSPEPDSNWQWITDEPLVYSNWSPGQPDNMNGNQNVIHFGELPSTMTPTWDDLNDDDPNICGYIIELSADTQTVGLFLNESGSFNGFTLFAPMSYTNTYLIDNNGLLVHSWESNYRPGFSVYLLENGNLLRTAKLTNPVFPPGGAGGRIEEYTWEGSLSWEFEYSNNQHIPHHDVEPLPNGNVLLIAWEYKTAAEAIAAGRNPSLLTANRLFPDHIIEVEPTGTSGGTIVWEWHVWDHLIQDYDSTKENYGVVRDHPELVDINFVSDTSNPGKPDWNHTNSIDYNEIFDQILLSVHQFNEIWVIDHSTTTEEAAGHTGGNSGKGGDLIYRWGNPQTYKRGNADDQKFFLQHDARWIESGNPGQGDILVFNNGAGRPQGNYSSVDEIVPPVDSLGNYELPPDSVFGPEEQIWIYTAPNPYDFFSRNISGAHRLPNGNTIVCEGPNGIFFEVAPDTEIVWFYVNPVTGQGPVTQGDTIPEGPQGRMNNVFRIYRYAPDFPGFNDKDMTPGYPIEIYYHPTGIVEANRESIGNLSLVNHYPNPVKSHAVFKYQALVTGEVRLKVYDILGQEIKTLVNTTKTAGYYKVVWDGKDNLGVKVSAGVYFYQLQVGDYSETKKLILIK